MSRITILVLIWSLAAGAFAAELSVQRSSAGGVTVAITPQDVSGKSKTWSFNVVLDTHTQDLSDDLLKTAALFDDKGGKYDPVAWEGAGPGGHHRTGTLTFKAVSPYRRCSNCASSAPAKHRRGPSAGNCNRAI